MKTLLKILSKDQFGFILKKDLEDLEDKMPNIKVLIRCGAQREVTEAWRAQAYMDQIEEQGDYVRDVSLPVAVINQLFDSPKTSPEVKQAISEMRSW